MPDVPAPDKRPEFWRSANPPWGVVRAVFADDDYAIVLDDLNGDYQEVEMTAYRRSGGEWDDLFTLDDQGFPDMGSANGGGWVLGFDGHYYNWLYGRERPGTSVALAFGDEIVNVAADGRGMWLRVEQDDDMSTELRRMD